MSIELFLTGIMQSLILALVAYGVMIPFRLLNIQDMSAEGAYPLGGTIYATLILHNFHPLISILFASLSCGLVGVTTGYLHLRLKINSILASIILSTMLYSINLRILGKPNISLFDKANLFDSDNIKFNIFLLVLILIIVIGPIILFLFTNLGLKLRAVGLNPQFAKKNSIPVFKYIVCTMFIASALTGLSGGVIASIQHYMDVGMGIGIVIHALASLMLGEALLGKDTIIRQFLAPLLGALVYQQLYGAALSLGLEPSDLKFVSGALVLIVMTVNYKVTRTG